MNLFSIFILICLLYVDCKAKFLNNEFEPNLDKKFNEVKYLDEDSAFYEDPDPISQEKIEPLNNLQEDEQRTENLLSERQHTKNINEDIKISEVEEELSRRQEIQNDVNDPVADDKPVRRNIVEDAPNEDEVSNKTAEEERQAVKGEDKNDVAVSEDVTQEILRNELSPIKSVDNDPSIDKSANNDVSEMSSSPDLVINMKGRSGADSLELEESKSTMKWRQPSYSGSLLKRKSHQQPNHGPLPKINIPSISLRTFEPITANPIAPHFMRNLENKNFYHSSEHKLDQPFLSRGRNHPLPKQPFGSRETAVKTIDDYSSTDTYQYQPPIELIPPVNRLLLQPLPAPINFPGFFNSPDVNNIRRNLHFFPFSNRNRNY